MNRRTFFQITGAAVGASAAGVAAVEAKYGLMTVERCWKLREQGVNLRVFLDGVDVSNHCKLAHDIEGWVVIFKQNVAGNHYIDFERKPPELAKETRYGVVEFRRA